MYNNIPEELRNIPAWVLWKLEDIKGKKPTKVPYNAKTNTLASTTDPNSWCDFNTAVSRCKEGNYSGIGFVFTSADPYTFIDLDDCRTLVNGDLNPNYEADAQRQIHIFQEFDSYSEVSPSGNGLHIIIKGKVPSGRRRAFIEVYSSGRYATFTGNVYNNKTEIKEQQEKLTQLWEQMGGSETLSVVQNQPQFYDDNQIINQALNAVNSDVFKILLEGKWQNNYPSQSEADLAFVNIIWFYSKNSEQTERIYRNSVLGNTDKKRKRADYISRMITKSADKDLPKIDIEGFVDVLNTKLKGLQKIKLEQQPPLYPPGLMGYIAQFIYAAAPRPVLEVAIGSAIGLMAGICGRSYNINNMGLNHYVLILADSGSGKQYISSGINKIIRVIKNSVPYVDDYVAVGSIASGQALAKHIGKESRTHCYVAILGEFGLTLEAITSKYANSADKATLSMLLQLYNNSGKNDIVRANIYSKKEDTVEAFDSPAFSLIGDCTPIDFYGSLNEKMVTSGLLPRFTIFEYKGEFPTLNKGSIDIHLDTRSPLHTQITDLVSYATSLSTGHKAPIDVKLSDEAQTAADSFNKEVENFVRGLDKDNQVEKALWTRAHAKLLKLSALVAVGVDAFYPKIQIEHIEWALSIIRADIEAIAGRFKKGDVGSNSTESKQVKRVVEIVKGYFSITPKQMKTYQVKPELFKQKIIPWTYIQRRLSSAFPTTNDIKKAVGILIDRGDLKECNNVPVHHGADFKGKEVTLVIANTSLFDDSD